MYMCIYTCICVYIHIYVLKKLTTVRRRKPGIRLTLSYV